jgi:hypothetical protein
MLESQSIGKLKEVIWNWLIFRVTTEWKNYYRIVIEFFLQIFKTQLSN